MVFWLILATSVNSCKSNGALQFLLDCAMATDSCLVFAIGLDCCYLDNEELNHPQRTTSNQVHKTLFLLTFFLPYLWSGVGGLEGRLNHIRTLNKVGSEKS